MRFPDECGHGERVCVIPSEKKNRPCTAVAWDPENPTRLAAAWTKVRGWLGRGRTCVGRALLLFFAYVVSPQHQNRHYCCSAAVVCMIWLGFSGHRSRRRAGEPRESLVVRV